MCPFQNCFHAHVVAKATLLDSAGHSFFGMTFEQQQHANELTRPCADAVLFLQPVPQPGENRWQLPMSVDIGMVQTTRFTLERGQKMAGIKYLLTRVITAPVLGHDLTAIDENDLIDIA